MAKQKKNKTNAMRILVREIEEVTGYIRGGCSPVGMKKSYRTFLDESAAILDRIYLSAGRRGVQMRLSPHDILTITKGTLAQLT